MTPSLFGLRGFLIDSPTPGELRARRDGAVVVEDGLIAEVGDYATLRDKPRAEPIRWRHSENVAIFPGLIDVHTHLPQYPAVARSETGLLPWLNRHVFPLEREFTGARARREAPEFFAALARHGTTTAMIYAAVYEESCSEAFRAAEQAGTRAIIGKMMMDIDTYGDLDPAKVISVSLSESERLCKAWHGAEDGRLEYAVSPRFAVSCSEEMMRGAAEIARRHGTFIQTHLSENAAEIARVRELHPSALDYTDVYDRSGLLTDRAVLGHGIHLSDREIGRIAEAGARIAHCPTSNLFLSSGIMPLDRLQAAGIPIGLGSDVAAGPELNLWQVMRAAIESQQARSFYEANVRVPTGAEVFYLGTQGGAEVLHKGDVIGSLDVGKEADIVVVDLATLLPYRRSHRQLADLTAEDVVSLCVYRGGPHATLETLVRGRSVYSAAHGELF